MKFMLQIYQGTALEVQSPLAPEEQQTVWADYAAINQTPGVTTGQGMAAPDQATTVRVKDGTALATDGPFAETKDGPDLDAAIALAARVPAARYGGAVEVRPLVDY